MIDRDRCALTLFERALTLLPGDRSRYLKHACGGDAALCERVERMLRADARLHALLDRPPGALLERQAVRPVPWEGQDVGPYRIVREIGRGGMGFVYLAERTDVGARVALKLVAASIGSPERSARFEYERRVLARLDHPHIARFLDAGVLPDGTLWLAMEYVEGSPIDAHCDARCLSVSDRLALLEQVADAVAHAHRNLLVHRDLKPSNILVSDAGVPKLVDFGIAKLLDDGAAGEALTLDRGSGPMTPEYAAPEQLRGEVVTTASDVYQLGIVLHELITGRRPTRADGEPHRHFDRAAATPMVRPSALVTTEVRPQQLTAGLSTRTAQELSALRGTSPEQLRRRLAGDLDAIVEWALQPQPADRYRSAAEFADELRRHRAGQPISARAASPRYRAGRFLRRHAVAVSFGCALLVLTSAAALAMLRQAQHVAVERDRSDQVSSVLERLVRYGWRGAVGADSSATRSMLNEIALEARSRLREDPRVWARILVPVGDAYRQLELADTASLLWSEAIAALEPLVPSDDRVLLDALGSLGVLRVTRGDVAEGIVMLERMLDDARALPDERREQLANSISFAGFGRQVAGDDAAARRLYDEALRIAETLPDSGGPMYDRTLLNVGYLMSRQGDPDAAEALFRQALARRLARDGPDGGGTLNAMASLARTLLARGAVDEAAPLADSILAARRRAHAPPHWSIADALLLHAAVQLARGGAAEAEAASREALAINRAIYGDDHMQVAYAEEQVADAIARQGRVAEAASVQRAAFDRYRRTVGPAHPSTAQALVRLAELEWERGETGTAIGLYADALARLEPITELPYALASPRIGLGTLLAEAGRCAEAAPLLRLGLEHGRPRSADQEARTRRAHTLLERCEAAARGAGA